MELTAFMNLNNERNTVSNKQLDPSELYKAALLKKRIRSLVISHVKSGFKAEVIPKIVKGKLLENKKTRELFESTEINLDNLIKLELEAYPDVAFYNKLYQSVFYRNVSSNEVVQFHSGDREYCSYDIKDLKALVNGTDDFFPLETEQKLRHCQFVYDPQQSMVEW